MKNKLYDLGWAIKEGFSLYEKYHYKVNEKDFYSLNKEGDVYNVAFWKNTHDNIYAVDTIMVSKDLEKIIEEWKKHLNEK